MLNLTEQKQYSYESAILAIYEVFEKWLSLIVKLTLPLWVIPFLTILLFLKMANIWKHLGSLISSIINPNFPPPLAYAILKGNGQYLRNQHQMVLTRQFYDYTSRRFMSVAELESESQVIEIQCDNEVGINYIAESLKSGNVRGLLSDQKLLRNLNEANKQIIITNYDIQGQSQQIDCFLWFNFKSKVNCLNRSSVDLVKILSYCSYHLSKQGYIVFGDYFEKGEVQTFLQMFGAYNLVVTDDEDITKNVDYAKKLLSKDRNQFEVKILNFIRSFFASPLEGKPYEQGKTFHVFILENKSVK